MESVAQQSPVAQAAPFVRWAGGKRALAQRLVVEILATSPQRYVEPFLGGGAVALALPAELPKVLADVNPHLIDCWLCIKNLPADLYRELRQRQRDWLHQGARRIQPHDWQSTQDVGPP
jgi:site-specific DNA-adenine methylase